MSRTVALAVAVVLAGGVGSGSAADQRDPPDPLFEFRPPVVDAGCKQDLREAGARFVDWPVRPVPLRGSISCQVPLGLAQSRGASGLRYRPPAKINCGFGLRLVKFESVMQEVATETLGARVAAVEQLGTYNCRRMAAYPDMVSEHSFANAIDIAVFVLANGRRVVVERDWLPRGSGPDPATGKPAALFLRRLTRRLYDEQIFSVVLTPSYDSHHRNHLHLDGAPYSVDGT